MEPPGCGRGPAVWLPAKPGPLPGKGPRPRTDHRPSTTRASGFLHTPRNIRRWPRLAPSRPVPGPGELPGALVRMVQVEDGQAQFLPGLDLTEASGQHAIPRPAVGQAGQRIAHGLGGQSHTRLGFKTPATLQLHDASQQPADDLYDRRLHVGRQMDLQRASFPAGGVRSADKPSCSAGRKVGSHVLGSPR